MIEEEIRRALYGPHLFGDKWNALFAGDGPRSEEMRRLLGGWANWWRV